MNAKSWIWKYWNESHVLVPGILIWLVEDFPNDFSCCSFTLDSVYLSVDLTSNSSGQSYPVLIVWPSCIIYHTQSWCNQTCKYISKEALLCLLFLLSLFLLLHWLFHAGLQVDALNVTSCIVAIFTAFLLLFLHFLSCFSFAINNNRVLGNIAVDFIWSLFLASIDMNHFPTSFHSLTDSGQR